VTKSAALLPVIPEKVRIHPLTAALLTTAAFLDLVDDEQIPPALAQPVLVRVGLYVQRLSDEAADRLASDLERLAKYAAQAGWPEEAQEFVAQFMSYCGFASEAEDGESDEEGEDEAPGRG
jgi:hydrogenase maturation factor